MMDQTPKVNAENVERGRFAGRPGRFSARAWGAVLRRVWLGIGNDNLSIVAAGVAFFGMLAIFPAITALISIYGLIRDPNDILSSLSSVRARLWSRSIDTGPSCMYCRNAVPVMSGMAI